MKKKTEYMTLSHTSIYQEHIIRGNKQKNEEKWIDLQKPVKHNIHTNKYENQALSERIFEDMMSKTVKKLTKAD